jgi:myo-inositol-1(or 4)-monophosphatase
MTERVHSSEAASEIEGFDLICEVAQREFPGMLNEAGKKALTIRAEGKMEGRQKTMSKVDLVTAADFECESLIVGKIKELFPGHAIAGEEGADVRNDSPWKWIIDPIDGTLNYFEGRPFGISVGLAYNGVPVLGMIMYPDESKLLSATLGKGAFINGERMMVENTAHLADARMSFDTSSKGYFPLERARYKKPLEGRTKSVTEPTCCTKTILNVIEGKIDAHVMAGATPFDIAAGVIIAQEAGCSFNGTHGPIDLNSKTISCVVAANEKCSQELLSLYNQEAQERKRRYFSALALGLKEGLWLHKEAGLWNRLQDGTRDAANITQHCLAEAARCRAIGPALELPAEVQRDLGLAAALHDFNKLEEKKYLAAARVQGSSEYEAFDAAGTEANALMREAQFSEPVIRLANSVAHPSLPMIEEILEKQHLTPYDLAALILHYIDDISNGSDWVKHAQDETRASVSAIDGRLDIGEANPRYQKLNEEGRTHLRGRTVFEALRQTGHKVENRLAAILSEKTGTEIRPNELALWIDARVHEQIGEDS